MITMRASLTFQLKVSTSTFRERSEIVLRSVKVKGSVNHSYPTPLPLSLLLSLSAHCPTTNSFLNPFQIFFFSPNHSNPPSPLSTLPLSLSIHSNNHFNITSSSKLVPNFPLYNLFFFLRFSSRFRFRSARSASTISFAALALLTISFLISVSSPFSL